jgi:hypothetical protein
LSAVYVSKVIILSREAAYLGDDISQFGLHLLLSALEPLPQVVADTAPLEQRAARLLGVLDLDETADVLDGAAHQGGAEDAVGDAGGLFVVVFGL